MLIDSPRLRAGDRDVWERWAQLDLQHAQTGRFRARVEAAEMSLAEWSVARQGYVGVSWGKDSVVVAHLADAIGWPRVWVRVAPISNPECPAVRDAFRVLMPHARIEEVVVEIQPSDDGKYRAGGSLERGFRLAERRFGPCHVSGIRGSESAQRKRFRRVSGGVTNKTMAPLINWSGDDVFAYLALHDLPVHPVYAMSMAGAVPRERLRVSALGGRRGRGTGRAEWERMYYPEVAQMGRVPDGWGW